MSEARTVNDRWELNVSASDHINWHLMDMADEGQEHLVPKRFASTPELAVDLEMAIMAREESKWGKGVEFGKFQLRRDLRDLLNAAPSEIE